MKDWFCMGLLDPNSYYMIVSLDFYYMMMGILLFIMGVILYALLFLALSRVSSDLAMMNNHYLEAFWTLAPFILLFFVAIPSMKNLYLLDSGQGHSLVLKAIGSQWYWSYEYSNKEESAYMSAEPLFRLLDTDYVLCLNYGFSINVLATSTDVIHSWALPSMGLKVDAVPGRLNSAYFWAFSPGVFYGQCSELCGINHSFMPIKLALVM